MSGLSGSGKTWVSGQLMATMPAIRIRSDLERKRMFGLSDTANSGSGIQSGIYTSDVNDRVYKRLCDTAGMILTAGHNVIMDAAFLHTADRAKVIARANDCNASCLILAVTAPIDTLRSRVRGRANKGVDASEAGPEILEHQIATSEPLSAKEQAISISCENTGKIDIDELAERINNHKYPGV